MTDTDNVEEIADTARIKIDKEEKEEFKKEFEEILDVFEKVEEIDTEEEEPSFHPVKLEPGSRNDEREETLDKEEVFKNAENVEKEMFKGPSA